MADWQFLRTCNKLNNHRSMHTCSRARGIRMRIMGAHVCRVRRALRLLDSRRGCACNYMARPSASASARVQVDGGVVAMGKGELVFDGVAISDTSATARRLRPRAPVGPSVACCGGPAPDRSHVQSDGGAVLMADGAVTFRGSSTIARTRAAVRPALPNAHAHARTWSTSLRC